jgi:hypothetical protein
VQCLGVIKDLVVTLFQLPMKSVVMDIVLADVPPKFGMLFVKILDKRTWGNIEYGPQICYHSCVWGEA